MIDGAERVNRNEQSLVATHPMPRGKIVWAKLADDRFAYFLPGGEGWALKDPSHHQMLILYAKILTRPPTKQGSA